MPELKNETPTKEELSRYFLEHCSRLMYPDVQTDLVNVSEAYRLGCNQFLRRVGECIFESLQRLNKLPRTDPFWQGTNKRPTILKLTDFGTHELKINPDNRQALWTLASLDVFYGANNFGREHWKRLRESADFDISWALLAGLWAEVSFGVGSGEMAKLLMEMGSVGEAHALLELFAESKSDHIAGWAREVVLELIQPK